MLMSMTQRVTFRTTVATAAALAAALVPVFLFGALSEQIRRDIAFDKVAIGIAVTVFFTVAAAGASPGGWVTQRVGPRRSMLLGVALASTASVGIGLDQLVEHRRAAGLGRSHCGLIDTGAAQTFTEVVPTRRQGLAFEVKEGSIPAASMLAGGAVPLLALTAGWRSAFVATALLAPVVSVLLPRKSASRRGPRRVSEHRARPSRRVRLLLAVGAGAGAATAAADIGDSVSRALSVVTRSVIAALVAAVALSGPPALAETTRGEREPVTSTTEATAESSVAVIGTYIHWTRRTNWLRYGNTTVLEGQVVAEADAVLATYTEPLQDAPVELFARPAGTDHWSRVATGRTDSDTVFYFDDHNPTAIPTTALSTGARGSTPDRAPQRGSTCGGSSPARSSPTATEPSPCAAR